MGVEALGDLVVNVGVDASGVSTGLDQVAAEVKRGAADMASELDGLGGGLDKAAGSAERMRLELMDLGQGTRDSGEGLKEFAANLKQAGEEMRKAGEALTAGFTLPLAALGTAALAAATDIHNAFSTIEREAGGTAEQVGELKKVFSDVFATLPVGAHDAAVAIAELSDRLNIAGPALTAVTTQMVNLAHITGSSLQPLVTEASRAFNQWGISTEQMAGKLNLLYNAANSTGASVQNILGSLKTFGPALREMGFSFDQATALLAKLDQEGLNSGRIMQGLGLAVRNLSKAGIDDPAAGLPVLIKMIKDAGSAGEANAIGLKAFGRASLDIVDAIRNGKLDIADFVKQLQGSTDSINDVANRTRTLGERFTILKNEMETALQPLGETLLRILEGVMEGMKPVIALVGDLAQAFAGLSPTTQAVIVGLAGIAAAIGPLLVGVGLMTTGFSSIATFAGTAMNAIGGLSGLLAGLATAVGVVAAAFAGWNLGRWLEVNLGEAKTLIRETSDVIQNNLSKSLHDTTTSSKDFTDAMARSVTGLKTLDPAAKVASQSAAQIKAALDSLVDGAQKAEKAFKSVAIPFKDLIPLDMAINLKALSNAADAAFNALVRAKTTIAEDRLALGELGKTMSDDAVVAQTLQNEFDKINQSLGDQAGVIQMSWKNWKDFDETIKEISSLNGLGAMDKQLQANRDAFKDLGIQAHTSTEQMIKDFELLKKQGLLDAKEQLTSTERILQLQIEDAKNAGEAISTTQLLALSKVKEALKNFGKDPVWEGVSKILDGAFKSLSDGITKSIFDFKNFGKNMMDTLKQVGEAIVHELIDKFILTKSNLDSLTKGVTDLLHSLFGGGGAKGVVSTGGLTDGADSALGTAVKDATGGGASQGASQGAGGLMGGLGGVVNMVSGIASAISGIIGNFQMSHMNKLLGEIEVSTRGMLNQLISLQKTFNQYLPNLDEVNHFLQKMYGEIFNIHHDVMDIDGWLHGMKLAVPGATPIPSTVLNGGGSNLTSPGGSTFYVAVTDVDIQKLMDQLVHLLEAKGLKV